MGMSNCMSIMKYGTSIDDIWKATTQYVNERFINDIKKDPIKISSEIYSSCREAKMTLENADDNCVVYAYFFDTINQEYEEITDKLCTALWRKQRHIYINGNHNFDGVPLKQQAKELKQLCTLAQLNQNINELRTSANNIIKKKREEIGDQDFNQQYVRIMGMVSYN